MARLYVMIGLPGAGKTTLARQIAAQEPTLLLSPDLWMTRLGLDGYDPRARDCVKALQVDMADQALRVGASVVLDSGFLHRHERDEAQAMAQARGAAFRRVYLNPGMDVLWHRLQARNAALPEGTFPVTKEHLALCATWLEPPGPDEPLWDPGSLFRP